MTEKFNETVCRVVGHEFRQLDRLVAKCERCDFCKVNIIDTVESLMPGDLPMYDKDLPENFGKGTT